MGDILLDSSYLVALGFPKDRYHTVARQFARTRGEDFLLPDVVLVEGLFNLRRLTNFTTALQFARLLVDLTPTRVTLTDEDFVRALDIIQKYADAELDFVDACLTAHAERLNITEIATLDRRDFSIIRPKHISYFTLVP